MINKLLPVAVPSFMSLFLLSGCGASDAERDEGGAVAEVEVSDDVEHQEGSQLPEDNADDEADREEEASAQEGESPVPSLENEPEPHEMSHSLREDSSWYLFAPDEYHSAQEWETSETSPTFDTDAETIDGFSCGVGSEHYQGNWYLDIEMGWYVSADHDVTVQSVRVVDDERATSGGTELSVLMGPLPCSAWRAAVQNEGINSDLYPRQIHVSEATVTTMIGRDSLAEQIMDANSEAPDIRSDEVTSVYYRFELEG